MSKSKFAAFCRGVAAALVDSQVISGTTLILVPISHTLRGVLFHASSAVGAVYANAFFQPLFIPADQISLDLGFRVGGGTRVWQTDSSAEIDELTLELTERVWPFLRRIESPEDILSALDSLNRRDANAHKARAFVLARIGQATEAGDEFEAYVELLSTEIPWQREERESLIKLVRELRLDPEMARHRLESWEVQTIAALHLQPFVRLINPSKIR